MRYQPQRKGRYMRILNRAAGFAAAAICLAASGCTSGISAKDVRQLGNYEIVYLKPEANFTADDNSGGAAYAALYLLAGPLVVAGSVAGVAQKDQYQRDALAANMKEIEGLGFDDRVHAVFVSAIDESWLPRREIKTVLHVDSPDDYTHDSHSDTVIYIKPKFTMTSFGQVFMVDVVVGAQKYLRDDVNPHAANLYKREFIFRHDLILKKPGMTWDQQKDVAHRLAQLGTDEAVQIWLENDGERLRADFEQDMPKIEAGVRQFFGDAPKTPGG